MNIYQIENEYQLLISAIIENGGEITDEQQLQLAINEEQLQTKATNYAFVIKQIKDRITARKMYMDKLKKDNGTDENLIERLENTIATAMNLYEKDLIQTPFVKISFRKNPDSVVVDDVNALPAEYKKVVVTESAIKDKIKEDLKAGIEIKGCSLSSSKSLQIK